MVSRGHEVSASAADETPELVTALDAMGVRFEPVRLARTGMNPKGDLVTLAELTRLLHARRPDVFLGYTAKPVIYGCAAARLAGVPRVHALITGLGYSFIDQASFGRRMLARLVRGMYRASLAQTTSVLFQNPDDRDQFYAEGMLARGHRSIITNGSGVDLGHYEALPPVTQPLTFLYIGRLLREKGVVELAEAARIVKAQHPGARIQLLGPFDSNPAGLTPRDIDTWVAGGAIEYLGETRDVRPYLAKASVFVLPSYREGTPRSTLEAMSMGRPVITTDVPGCRETVIPGETGLLTEVRNARALADAMLAFCRTPDRIPSMGRASRAYAERKYDVRRVNELILAELGL
jgi:glycosyltransferase involved in cell wall biosynthesis